MGNLKNSENAHNLGLGEHGLKGLDISVLLKLSFIITVVGSLPRLRPNWWWTEVLREREDLDVLQWRYPRYSCL